MSKIVCDVCGSSYSEAEAYCPICGTKKSDEVKPVVETTVEEQSPKAGKFSQTTNRTGTGTSRQTERSAERRKPSNNSNLPMIIIVAVLLLAIVVVCVFIGVKLVGNQGDETTGDTVSTEAPIPCTGIELADPAQQNLVFNSKTETVQLVVNALPENTNEDVNFRFKSSDASVVRVDKDGNVTPITNGEATITITYGDYVITVNVTCQFVDPNAALELNNTDVTLSPTNGLVYQLKAKLGTVDVEAGKVVWTSSNPAVATVDSNGKVTAVGDGYAVITAEYNGKKATCAVHTNKVNASVTATYGIYGGYNFNGDWTLDITKDDQKSLTLTLRNKDTKEVITGVTWSVSDGFDTYCTGTSETDGSYKVTIKANAAAKQTVKVYAEYEGKKYECLIRIAATSAT